MDHILDHFDALTEMGLQVIPLRKNSKIPLCKGWTKGWNKKFARAKLGQFPDSNIGMLLGKVIDVEGDSPEANEYINSLIPDYPHPSYQSTRSTHHLFENPYPDLKIFKHKDIEFRGWGHQSVLPPSEHEGVVYKWLNTDAFPVPPLPEKLRDFYKEKSRQKKKPKNGCFSVYCKCCCKHTIMHRKRYQLEIESLSRIRGGKPTEWLCRRCRDIDLRDLCRKVRVDLRRHK